jgi:hypothetical protein
MLDVKNFTLMLTVAAFNAVAPAAAAEPPAADPDLVQFRQAYTTGSGLAYVVIKDDKGEKVYRYGDASRQAAQNLRCLGRSSGNMTGRNAEPAVSQA